MLYKFTKEIIFVIMNDKKYNYYICRDSEKEKILKFYCKNSTIEK